MDGFTSTSTNMSTTKKQTMYAVTVTHYIMGTSELNVAESFGMMMHSLPGKYKYSSAGFNGWSLDAIKPMNKEK